MLLTTPISEPPKLSWFEDNLTFQIL